MSKPVEPATTQLSDITVLAPLPPSQAAPAHPEAATHSHPLSWDEEWHHQPKEQQLESVKPLTSQHTICTDVSSSFLSSSAAPPCTETTAATSASSGMKRQNDLWEGHQFKVYLRLK